jgi:diacylglycerol kinase
LEWIAISVAIGLVLIAEFFNTAIESLADFVSPGFHKDIGRIKDISAGAVLVAVLIAVIIGILIFWPHLKILAVNWSK